MSYKKGLLKRRLEYIGMFPFVLAGRIWGSLRPMKKPTSTFLFFPSADLGGSIKVNADIARCIAGARPLVIFSKRTHNLGYLRLFDGFEVLDLHKKIDNKLYHFVNFFYRGVLAAWINREQNAVVFGGESLFFYKMLPHLAPGVRRFELCHLDTWLGYSIGFIDLITYRIFSTRHLETLVKKQYASERLDPVYFDRLYFIENKIDIPPYSETDHAELQIIYVGRGAPQKRVYLVGAIARRLHEAKAPVHFSFAGDVSNILDRGEYPYCTFYGNVSSEEKMQALYRSSDVLILTSAYEGLPLVVMQMMAHGRVVVSTAVNGIPDYIRHGENGLLITETIEEKIVEQGASLLQELASDPVTRKSMGEKSREIARQKFSGEVFCHQYNRLFSGEPPGSATGQSLPEEKT